MSDYKQIKEHYREAALNHLAKELSGQEWNTFQVTRTKAAEQKKQLKERYAKERKTRVEQEIRRLQRKKTSPERHLRYPKHMGYDQLDKTSLLNQARRNVENRHFARIALVEKREEDSVQKLVDKARSRKQLKDKPTNDFSRAVDRRSNPDRREGANRRTESQDRRGSKQHQTTKPTPSIRRRR